MIADTADSAPHPRKRRGWLIAGVIGIALIILVIVHLISGKKAKPAPSVQVVSVASAILGEMPETLNELGTVTPIATATNTAGKPIRVGAGPSALVIAR